MKTFPLSTTKERIFGIIFSVIMCIMLLALPFAMRNDIPMLLLSGVCVFLVILVLLVYLSKITKAVCIVDPVSKTLYVKGFQQRTIDLTTAVQLETIPNRIGHVESRSLAFTDAEGKVLAIVPTNFTSKRGVLAEPMAKEMAVTLNLSFKANVPVWEYDEEAKKAHDIEMAQQAKEAAKVRRKENEAKRIAKLRMKHAAVQNKKDS